ncbi:MAG: hypothetical protein KF745_07370 [Phycisphaeraceae bacterium]|nr:hypothetical protein [Phycisphaeraceae bacterium]
MKHSRPLSASFVAPGSTARLVLVLVIGAACGGGCSTPRDPSKAGPPATMVVKQDRMLNVQVFRDEAKITMTNTTAEPIPAGRMWVNAWYSIQFEGLGVGETMVLSLDEFRDQYGDAFRGGGFFAAKQPERLVLAQIQTEDQVLGLVVVGGQE